MVAWKGEEPVVSIVCATYQHVGFIEDALRGFLGQETDFPFEILVRDDASTDGTAEIVCDYADRYPNIIRATLETENRYPTVKPSEVFGPMIRGEFVASCEGDDYWIDPEHLQSSVVALRRDQGLSLAAGLTVHTVAGIVTKVRPNVWCRGRISRMSLMSLCNIGLHPSGLVYRSRDRSHLQAGHATRNSLLGTRGSGVVRRQVVSVRRIHQGGIHSGQPPRERDWASYRSNRRLLHLHLRDRRLVVASVFALRGLLGAGVAVVRGVRRSLIQPGPHR
jgi:glycosyltransferase involved in cell wall biosynthesis